MDNPHNPVSKHIYQGRNAELLTEVCTQHGYAGAFATFRQWREAGRTVKRDEHASARITSISFVPTAGDLPQPRRVKRYPVFAIEQTEELQAS